MRICTNVRCPQRFDCKLFSNALEVNAGKVKVYDAVECTNFNQYEK